MNPVRLNITDPENYFRLKNGQVFDVVEHTDRSVTVYINGHRVTFTNEQVEELLDHEVLEIEREAGLHPDPWED